MKTTKANVTEYKGYAIHTTSGITEDGVFMNSLIYKGENLIKCFASHLDKMNAKEKAKNHIDSLELKVNIF